MYWNFLMHAHLNLPVFSFIFDSEKSWLIYLLKLTFCTKLSIKFYCNIQVLKLITRTTLWKILIWTVVPVHLPFWNHTGEGYFLCFQFCIYFLLQVCSSWYKQKWMDGLGATDLNLLLAILKVSSNMILVCNIQFILVFN